MTQPPADALNALAPLLRVQPELQQVCRFGAQWLSDHPEEPGRWAPFHFVTAGACVVTLQPSGRDIPLSTGDVVVLPHGSRHVVRGPTTPADAAGPFDIRTRHTDLVAVKSNLDGEPETQLVCGRLRFEQAADNLVLATLPDAIVVSADAPGAPRMGLLMRAIQEEVEAAHPGAAAIAHDLASALFVMVVRTHLQSAERRGGLPALLAHRQLGRVIAAMLDAPARNWTLDDLAACAHASRASLVRMFRHSAQHAPLEYLAELRLGLAWRKLCASALPIAVIAAEVGYQSESAFSRAFHRRFGMRPGAARATAQQALRR